MRASLSCCLAALGDAAWRVTVCRAITFVSTIMVSTSWTGALERRAVPRRGETRREGRRGHCRTFTNKCSGIRMRHPTVTAKPATDRKQRRISANKLKHPKRQSGLVKPADEKEKRDKKRRIRPRELYIPSGSDSSPNLTPNLTAKVNSSGCHWFTSANDRTYTDYTDYTDYTHYSHYSQAPIFT